MYPSIKLNVFFTGCLTKKHVRPQDVRIYHCISSSHSRELSVDTGKEEWATWVCNTLSVDEELKKEEVTKLLQTNGSVLTV
jgi:hypothetical protein